jgi:hypothetical protein
MRIRPGTVAAPWRHTCRSGRPVGRTARGRRLRVPLFPHTPPSCPPAPDAMLAFRRSRRLGMGAWTTPGSSQWLPRRQRSARRRPAGRPSPWDRAEGQVGLREVSLQMLAQGQATDQREALVTGWSSTGPRHRRCTPRSSRPRNSTVGFEPASRTPNARPVKRLHASRLFTGGPSPLGGPWTPA